MSDRDLSLSNSDNVTKYKAAGALKIVLNACTEGAKIGELCKLGDSTINQECSKVYTKQKKMIKGIAFPTCVNLNHYICHLSPISSDPEFSLVIKNGDTVKVELGVQIDGFSASSGYTIVVGSSKEAPVTGRQADVIKAAHIASEAALRLLKPGNKNYKITEAVQKIAVEEFGVKPIEGLVSSQILPITGEGEKQIIFNPSPQHRASTPECEFLAGEVYTIDIMLSTGPAKTKESFARTTVFKRLEQMTYNLRMATSRKFLSEVQSKFGYMPFSLGNMDDEVKARAGLVECVRNRLILPYAVLEEDKDAFLAQFMFTALIMPNGNLIKVSGLDFDESSIKSEKSVSDGDILKLLAQPLKADKKI